MTEIVKIRDLRENSRQIWRKNGIIAYFICIFTTLIACGFLALNLLLSSLFVVLVPLIIMPLYFACQASIRLMRNTETLTIGGFFRCYFGYFSEHFASTFRVIRSSLFSLIFYGGVLLTSITVAIPCFYFLNYYGFKTFIDSINIFSSTSNIDALLNTYSNTIDMLFICISYPSLSVFSFVYLFLTDKNSISLFYRLDNTKYPGKYISSLNDLVIKNNKKQFYKSYFALNWPFYLLFLIGYGLGFYLGYLYYVDYVSLFTFSLICGLGISFILYGPNLFANKEAIYNSLKDKYVIEDAILKTQFASSIQNIINNYQESQENNKKDSHES